MSNRGDGGAGDGGIGGALPVAPAADVQFALQSIADTVGSMQNTMMTMIRKMERTDEVVRAVEWKLTQQGEIVQIISTRMNQLDRKMLLRGEDDMKSACKSATPSGETQRHRPFASLLSALDAPARPQPRPKSPPKSPPKSFSTLSLRPPRDIRGLLYKSRAKTQSPTRGRVQASESSSSATSTSSESSSEGPSGKHSGKLLRAEASSSDETTTVLCSSKKLDRVLVNPAKQESTTNRPPNNGVLRSCLKHVSPSDPSLERNSSLNAKTPVAQSNNRSCINVGLQISPFRSTGNDTSSEKDTSDHSVKTSSLRSRLNGTTSKEHPCTAPDPSMRFSGWGEPKKNSQGLACLTKSSTAARDKESDASSDYSMTLGDSQGSIAFASPRKNVLRMTSPERLRKSISPTRTPTTTRSPNRSCSRTTFKPSRSYTGSIFASDSPPQSSSAQQHISRSMSFTSPLSNSPSGVFPVSPRRQALARGVASRTTVSPVANSSRSNTRSQGPGEQPLMSTSTLPNLVIDTQPCTPEEIACRVGMLSRRLLCAAHEGKTDEVRDLLDKGADVNYCNSLKWTPLHKSAAKAHADALQLLIKRGADVCASTTYGFTALHMAAYNDRHGRCVTRLIEAGSDLDSANRCGSTPLHAAVECGNVAAMLALLAAGANKGLRDEMGRTPVDMARSLAVRRLLKVCGRRGRARHRMDKIGKETSSSALSD